MNVEIILKLITACLFVIGSFGTVFVYGSGKGGKVALRMTVSAFVSAIILAVVQAAFVGGVKPWQYLCSVLTGLAMPYLLRRELLPKS